MTLTPSQAKVLAAILRHLGETGWPPSRREIADACGWTSSASTDHHLHRLKYAGYIRLGARSRQIQVLRDVNGRRVRIGLHHIAEEA